VSSKLTFDKLDMSEKLMILFTAENNKDILVEMIDVSCQVNNISTQLFSLFYCLL
jgi:hypothetical protein